MKTFSSFLLHSLWVLLLLVSVPSLGNSGKDQIAQLKEQTRTWMQNQPIQFLENQGQMADIDGEPVPFVLFKASAPGMDMYVTEKGLTYFFLKVTEEEKEKNDLKYFGKEEENVKIEYDRIDMDLKGASIKKENIVKEIPSVTDFNYFYPHCSEGIYGVKQYEKATIKNIYKGIDWVLYNSTDKGFKYDFIVHPNADPKQIKLLYHSAQQLELSEDGSICIKTPFGTLIENAPVSYLQESGKSITSAFTKKIVDEYSSEVTFRLSDYSTNETLIIDPLLFWASFYGGGNNADGPMSITTDNPGNVFVAGYTYSANFPSQNAGTFYQGVFAGGIIDAFILKFDNFGNRLWATFYGGSGADSGYSLDTDGSGNVFVTGSTTSTNFPLQNTGTFYQGSYGGGAFGDAFILKFDNSGNRLWATYYGGSGDELGNSITIDGTGNVFITGFTSSTNFSLQNAGTFYQGAIGGGGDVVILKFDNSGNRLWATYYGGSINEGGFSITCDGIGNVFVTGYTGSTNFPLQNAGTFYQGAIAGVGDAIILKFDNFGNRLWATYYGGSGSGIGGNDWGTSITTDGFGNVFVMGVTASTNFPVQNAGTFYQGANGGGQDVFILKFDNFGNRLWATYYGGSGGDGIGISYGTFDNLAIDACNNVYMSFETTSTALPSQPSCDGGYFDNTHNGGQYDIFIVLFSNAGVQLWNTYLGGDGHDFRGALATDGNNNLFVVGEWTIQNGVSINPSTYPLTNPGGSAYYDGTFNGGTDDGCIVKFCSAPCICSSSPGCTGVLSVSVSSQNILCNGLCTGTGGATPIGGISPYTYSWTGGQTTQTATGLCVGSYTVLITDASGTTNTAVVTITQPSAIILNANSTINTNCITPNGTATVTVAGGTPGYAYNWSNGQSTQTATGLSLGTYTVSVTDANGCTKTQTVTVTSTNPMTLSASSTPSGCLVNNGTATANPASGTTPYIFSWNNGQTVQTATGLSAGTYTASVTDANGCTKTQTVTVTSANPMTLSASSTPSGCLVNNGTATANPASGTIPYTYSWSNTQTTQTITGLGAGTYMVAVTDANGCTQTQTVSVTQLSGSTASASASQNTITAGASTTLSASGGGTYQWSPSTGLSCTTCANTAATPLLATEYCVVVTDANNCKDTACITIKVKFPCGTLFIPNAFSPNDDGENDEFCLQGGSEQCIKDLNITIYDRWGEKVYASIDKNFCWDGIYQSRLMNSAVFVYYLNAILTDDTEIIKQGNISLIR